jgi:hypothetical protein
MTSHTVIRQYDNETSTQSDHNTCDFVRHTGGEYLSLLELRSKEDLEVAEICFANGEPFGRVSEHLGIRFGRECDMTNDAWRFTPTAQVLLNGVDPRDPEVTARLIEMGYVTLHQGRTFRQFDELWGETPHYLVGLCHLHDRPYITLSAGHYRLAHREIAGPGDENVSIWSLLPPGCCCGNKAPTEKHPWKRPTVAALWILSQVNSYLFDFLLSLRVRATVNAFIRDSIPLPKLIPALLSLAHSALRLSSNHSGYAPLWREQLGDTWREPKSPFTWPVLATDDERWEVRAAIDAVVADAYGLNREQYAHVLSAFSHKSYPQAPALCLAKFDELKQIGLDAFTKKYDPYWDIPLNESLPKPVIELPMPAGEGKQNLFGNGEGGSGSAPRRRSTRKR